MGRSASVNIALIGRFPGWRGWVILVGMYKLIALFTQPEELEEFERRWSHEFVGLAEKMPGLRRATVSRIEGGPAGPLPYHLIHEFYFDDKDALLAAMTSPEGIAAARCLMDIAAKDVTLMFSEHMEEVGYGEAAGQVGA
jgi:uncharacterized protein (TIGR02118 family)